MCDMLMTCGWFLKWSKVSTAKPLLAILLDTALVAAKHENQDVQYKTCAIQPYKRFYRQHTLGEYIQCITLQLHILYTLYYTNLVTHTVSLQSRPLFQWMNHDNKCHRESLILSCK